MNIKLNFLGIGSGFNLELGNSSAFFKDKYNNLYLIDCGFDVFAKIIKFDLLKDVNKVYVFLTHLHDDHSGSIASLIFYCFYVLNKKVEVMHPSYNIARYMSLQGGLRQTSFKITSDSTIYNDSGKKILSYNFIPVKHIQGMNCYGLRIKNHMNKEEHVIYYSGDTLGLFNGVDKYDSMYSASNITVYQEVTHTKTYDGAVHMDLETLSKLIPKENRLNVYCMHIGDVSLGEIFEQGFRIPEIYKGE
jgi:phosphoribosyl 1,2-cyclic phosphodiesterase